MRTLLKFVRERLSKGQSVFGESLKSSEDQIHKSTCHVHVVYLKPDSPFSFCDLSVYMPVQLGASPPLPPLNYFSLPPPLLPVHTHTPQGISRQGPFWKDIACWCNSSKSTRFVPSLLRKYQGNIKFTCPTVLGLFV